jgi:carboxypeptidase Taq
MGPQDAYEELLKRSNELAYLGSAIAVLDWDQRTQIPAKGHPHRVNQLAALARIRHTMITDPAIGEGLASVEGSELTRDPASAEAVNVREWRRSYDRAMKIPEELAVNLARAGAEGQAVWERARPRNEWAQFKPYLERIVSLKRQEADAVGYDHEPYDALLDMYEQGETARNLEPIFQQLTEALVPLIRRIQSSGRRPDREVLRGPFPEDAQRSFSQAVARQLGYDLEAGRLDVSAHPFTTGIGPGDVRITTRYRLNDFSEAFFAVIHEAGHAIYHQGLPLKHWGSPVCRPISLGINESQSRMWENMVARSQPFWQHFYPKARTVFPSLREVSQEAFLHAINEVKPSLIRVEADEVTYNLHVLLRFELEVALIRGDLQVEDLPEAWNRKMDKLLGLVPPDHSRGVMQDVHWSTGSIGYFPTYTLGNLYAAQFFQKARKDLGNPEESMAQGEFGDLLAWLRQNIHSRGSTYLPRDLLERVTGEALNPDYLIDYLEAKYSALYGL